MIVEAGSINWYDYLSKFGMLDVEKKKRRRAQNKHRILNVYCAFDIETSTIWLNEDHSLYDVHSFMYVWQFQIEKYTVKGRTWDEFFKWLELLKTSINRIREENKLSVNPLLVIWVHNLAYEFQWLSGLYPFTNDEVFFRDVRKPIYCRMFDTFELRCSYIQTNMSLSALCKQTGVKEKLSGQMFDYDKIRFPWTPLSAYEEEYTTVDVQSLVEAMRYRISRGGDNLQTVPLTSTGYVRRECKEALRDLYLDIREMKPDEKIYRLLRKAFRGGNTHANRYYVDKIIDNVYSYDISSSYPTQQLTHMFPMKPFRELMIEHLKNPADRIRKVFMFIGLGYAVVATYQFKNMRLRNKREPIPYISLSKCQAMGTDDYEMIIDNGRILQCGYIEISATEIDLEIIMDQYTFDGRSLKQTAHQSVFMDEYDYESGPRYTVEKDGRNEKVSKKRLEDEVREFTEKLETPLIRSGGGSSLEVYDIAEQIDCCSMNYREAVNYLQIITNSNEKAAGYDNDIFEKYERQHTAARL